MKRWPKVRTHCTVCKKLRIVTCLYPTTKAERVAMAKNYVCSDCQTPSTPSAKSTSLEITSAASKYV